MHGTALYVGVNINVKPKINVDKALVCFMISPQIYFIQVCVVSSQHTNKYKNGIHLLINMCFIWHD